MKKLCLVLLVMPLILISCKQKNETPDAVMAKFAEMFEGVTEVNWEMDDDSLYEASFTFDGYEWEADFKEDGTWMETERELEDGEMPEKAMEYLAMFYPDMEMDYYLEKTPDGDYYEAEMEVDSVEMEVYFDMEGNMKCDKDNPVISAYKKNFEGAEGAEWKKTDDGYRVMFTMEGKEMKAGFDVDGNWICTKSYLTAEDMPEGVTSYLEKMKMFEADKFKKKETSEGVTYYVYGMMKDVETKMKFDGEGNFLEMKEVEKKMEKAEKEIKEAPAKEGV